jgi:hypothetical protein
MGISPHADAAVAVHGPLSPPLQPSSGATHRAPRSAPRLPPPPPCRADTRRIALCLEAAHNDRRSTHWVGRSDYGDGGSGRQVAEEAPPASLANLHDGDLTSDVHSGSRHRPPKSRPPPSLPPTELPASGSGGSKDDGWGGGLAAPRASRRLSRPNELGLGGQRWTLFYCFTVWFVMLTRACLSAL